MVSFLESQYRRHFRKLEVLYDFLLKCDFLNRSPKAGGATKINLKSSPSEPEESGSSASAVVKVDKNTGTDTEVGETETATAPPMVPKPSVEVDLEKLSQLQPGSELYSEVIESAVKHLAAEILATLDQ